MIEDKSSKIAENKMIILYTLSIFDMPLVESQLTHFILEKNLINYFLFKKNFSELMDSWMIEASLQEGLTYYTLSSLGYKALEMFNNLLSDEYKNLIALEVNLNKKSWMHQNNTIANYIRMKDKEYRVYLMAIENGTPLLELRITLFSEEQCIKICTNWRKNAPAAFKKIMDSITT